VLEKYFLLFSHSFGALPKFVRAFVQEYSSTAQAWL
jgi:hypothetical protein